MRDDAAYLTVAAWPSNWDRAQMSLAVVKAAGLHPSDAERRVQGGVPLVLARMPQVAAESAEEAFRKMGVESLAISVERLAQAPPPLRARRLVKLGRGRYTAELWRGKPVELAMDHVWLLVRAKIRKVTLGEIRADAQVVGDEDAGYAIESGVMRERTLKLRELLELHTLHAQRVRIDGSKFSFDVLGSDRSVTDASSADRLALMLAEEAPRARVDAGFAGMAGGSLINRRDLPVAMLDRQRFPDDDPVFDFYSVWLSERYRRLRGGADETARA